MKTCNIKPDWSKCAEWLILTPMPISMILALGGDMYFIFKVDREL